MPLYLITLVIADEEKRKNINLCDWYDDIVKAKNQYNSTSFTAKNKKSIEQIVILEKEIQITLNSSVLLETPTLALKLFSRYLITNSEFGTIAANKNSLFRGSSKSIESQLKSLTGPEMVGTLTELIILNRKTDQELINEIMTLLIKWKEQL